MKKIIVITSVIGITAGNALAAENKIPLSDINFSSESVSVETSLGWLGGEAKEYVYDTGKYPGQKISQLNWKIKNAAIVKADISWEALPWLTVNARGWTTLASGSGNMDDYDWANGNPSRWQHWSTHQDTRLNYANEFDLNLKSWFLVRENYKLAVVAGYQETRFSWTAFGGSFNYYYGTNVGQFAPGKPAIGYQQTFNLPYIGVTGQYRYNNLEFNALFKFSDWVTAKDNDEHYTRNITFRGKGDNAAYYSVALDAGYYVTPNTKVFTELAWSQFTEGKGALVATNNSTGKVTYRNGDAGGMENKNYSITLGVKYQF